MSDTRHPRHSIILVEDNILLREELASYLEEDGYAVRGVDCGSELNDIIFVSMPDILILDLNLPEEDGISIARRIKAAMPGVGIVILTARMRSTDRLEGYSAGADVYLTKPTRPEEISIVVNNLLDRLKPQAHSAGWVLDAVGMFLQSPKGELIRLTPAEHQLIMELAINGGCVEHDRLFALLGSDDLPEKINKARIEVLISRLRSKLEPFCDGGAAIRALRGRGYQLNFNIQLKNLPSAQDASSSNRSPVDDSADY